MYSKSQWIAGGNEVQRSSVPLVDYTKLGLRGQPALPLGLVGAPSNCNVIDCVEMWSGVAMLLSPFLKVCVCVCVCVCVYTCTTHLGSKLRRQDYSQELRLLDIHLSQPPQAAANWTSKGKQEACSYSCGPPAGLLGQSAEWFALYLSLWSKQHTFEFLLHSEQVTTLL